MTDRLYIGQSLKVGGVLISNNERYALVLQKDGNLVIYPIGSTGALWASGTDGNKVFSAVMQTDGNFVIYGASGALWATGTNDKKVAWLVMQDDGNLVLYAPDGSALWASNTAESPRDGRGSSVDHGDEYCCTVFGQDGSRKSSTTIIASSRVEAYAKCAYIMQDSLFPSGFGVSGGAC